LSGRSNVFLLTNGEKNILIDTKFDLNNFGFNAYIMHTPGHTTGSVSVIIDDEVAIVGGCMFGVFKWSVFPPYAMDVKQMIFSCGKLLETNCSIFIPAHGSANSRSLVQKDYNKRIKRITAYNTVKCSMPQVTTPPWRSSATSARI
jgi:glyoxylase-like metal-dependent hydrolase (beta-lactamase superfamily II)